MPASRQTRVGARPARTSPPAGVRRRHAPPPEPIGEIQRSRLVAATIETVVELGYDRLTVAQVIARAHVSRKTFYDVFCDRDDCFLAAFEHCVARAGRAVEGAYLREGDWRDGVRAGLACLLALLEEDRAVARLCLVESLRAGDRVLRRRAELLRLAARAFDPGHGPSPGAGADRLIGEAIVGGIAAVVHAWLVDGSDEPLAGMLGPLMAFVVLPYLGMGAARGEIRRAAGSTATRTFRAQLERDDPLGGLELRLTYRTVRVLSAVGERPGASNRETAEAAGIADRGQASKLLARLEGLGLLENRGAGAPLGAANAWHLTPRGVAVTSMLRPA